MMNDSFLTLIERAFRAPRECLGTIERNAEIKVVYFMLCALGWDPVEDIALGFQIRRQTIPGGTAKAANAADFVLRSAQGLCAVGDAKQWDISKKEWTASLGQIKRYQTALEVPRAFLSCGWRWLILDEKGYELLQLEEKNPRALLHQLSDPLGKETIAALGVHSDLWSYGLDPH